MSLAYSFITSPQSDYRRTQIMRSILFFVMLGFLFPAAAWAGQAQQVPTLGTQQKQPPGQSTTVTANRRKLLSVHALYIGRIDNGLNADLAQVIGRLAWARVVTKPDEADAILQGTCFDDRRLKEIHSEIFINDRATGASIWQDVVRVHAFPPPLKKAVAETATKVASDLRKSLDVTKSQ